MSPTVDERLASVIRALSDVVLPSLPSEAGLAQEQIHLSVGHLQILRAQLDGTPDFEREEYTDAVALGCDLIASLSADVKADGAYSALQHALENADAPGDVRSARSHINGLIAELIATVHSRGNPATIAAMSACVVHHEQARSLKDRKWFAPFGFDRL